MDRVFLRGRTILCRSVGLTTKLSGVGCFRAAVSAHHQHYNLMSIRKWSEASNTALKRRKKASSNLRQGGASSGRIAVLDQGGKNGKMPKLCTGCGVEMINNMSDEPP